MGEIGVIEHKTGQIEALGDDGASDIEPVEPSGWLCPRR